MASSGKLNQLLLNQPKSSIFSEALEEIFELSSQHYACLWLSSVFGARATAGTGVFSDEIWVMYTGTQKIDRQLGNWNGENVHIQMIKNKIFLSYNAITMIL